MSQVDVVIKGHDQLSPTMRECRGSVTDFNQALEVAGKVARTVGQIYEATVGEFLEYADTVGDLSSITGESTENTSRFVTVLGDFGIEMGQITAAGRAMRDDGLAPTLDTLAQLSDRYLALAPGMERVNFLQDNLGRGGAEFVDVLEQGSAAILARADAVAPGNVLTAEEIRLADELKVSMRELNDEWTAFTRTLSLEAMPLIQSTVGELGDLATVLSGEMIPPERLTLLSTLIITIQDVAGALGLWEPAFHAADGAGREWVLGMDNQLDDLDRLAYEALPTATEELRLFSDEQLLASLAADSHSRMLGIEREAIEALRDRNIVITVTTIRREIQEILRASQMGGYTALGATAHAAGGPLSLITEVGEAGTEGIIDGIVIPHDPWEQLKRLGLIVDQQAQKGGDVKIPIWQPKKSGSSAGIKSGGEIKSGGGDGTGGGETATVADIAAEVQQASAQESAALVASIPAAAASAASEQGRQQAVEIRASSAENTAVLRQVLRAIEKLNQTFPTVVRDAVERVM
ncbi:MAG: hypothetical protein NTU91_01145 [Chloroflexi bacterium]|nr:hypothetical protein [Chloroflexota bacterium]